MESGYRIEESRWHRPVIYITLASMYLLVLSGILVSLTAYLYFFPSDRICDSSNYYCGGYSGREAGLVGLLFLGFLWLVDILVFPSAVGASLSLLGKKIGNTISLIALTLWTVISSFLMFGWLNAPSAIGNNLSGFTITIFILIGNVITYAFLIKGRRQVQWKSKSHLSQNNSSK